MTNALNDVHADRPPLRHETLKKREGEIILTRLGTERKSRGTERKSRGTDGRQMDGRHTNTDRQGIRQVRRHAGRIQPKLQALVYDILPSTTAVFSYAIGSRKQLTSRVFLVLKQ